MQTSAVVALAEINHSDRDHTTGGKPLASLPQATNSLPRAWMLTCITQLHILVSQLL